MIEIAGYEVLQQDGFVFQTLSGRIDLLHADHGDGYRNSVRIGAREGLRTWKIKIDALPDSEDYLIPDNALSRAEYLWDFFLRQKAASNKPFWVLDLRSDRLYLAEFADDQIDYEVLCGYLFSTGLNLRQRRVPGVTSPIPYNA